MSVSVYFGSIAASTWSEYADAGVLLDANSVFGSKALHATIREGEQILASSSIRASFKAIGCNSSSFSQKTNFYSVFEELDFPNYAVATFKLAKAT